MNIDHIYVMVGCYCILYGVSAVLMLIGEIRRHHRCGVLMLNSALLSLFRILTPWNFILLIEQFDDVVIWRRK